MSRISIAAIDDNQTRCDEVKEYMSEVLSFNVKCCLFSANDSPTAPQTIQRDEAATRAHGAEYIYRSILQ